MSTPANRAQAAYRNYFGGEPAMMMRAPGRVNLIGEHTDYNDGFVLPAAIDRETVVAIGPANGRDIAAIALDFNAERDNFAPHRPIGRVTAEWANYVRGMAAALIGEGMGLKPANMVIAGDVPLGSGLSSSASLEIAVAYALSAFSGHTADPTHMAKLAQRAENDFVGCACGIMDQLIATRGRAGHALLIDCRSLDCTPVPLPGGISILIAHSGVRHAHAGGEYNDRRRQCEAAARHYGAAMLRDVTLDRLEADKAGLDDVCYRRARHVVTENARTVAAASALKQGDMARLGTLMAQSHISMRDDFEITIPAIDRLADIMASPIAGEGGARMTGGGFGGCVIALAPDHKVTDVVDAIANHYRTPEGLPADVFVCQASAGTGQI